MNIKYFAPESSAPALGDSHASFCIKPSPLGGEGLFATRTIRKNDRVTFYDGKLVFHSDICPETVTSHLITVSFKTLAVDGLRGEEVRDGDGAASVANDNSPYHNAVFKKCLVNHGTFTVIVLVAERTIYTGEEITVSYGSTYWRNSSHPKTPGIISLSHFVRPKILSLKDCGLGCVEKSLSRSSVHSDFIKIFHKRACALSKISSSSPLFHFCDKNGYFVDPKELSLSFVSAKRKEFLNKHKLFPVSALKKFLVMFQKRFDSISL